MVAFRGGGKIDGTPENGPKQIGTDICTAHNHNTSNIQPHDKRKASARDNQLQKKGVPLEGSLDTPFDGIETDVLVHFVKDL